MPIDVGKGRWVERGRVQKSRLQSEKEFVERKSHDGDKKKPLKKKVCNPNWGKGGSKRRERLVRVKVGKKCFSCDGSDRSSLTKNVQGRGERCLTCVKKGL